MGPREALRQAITDLERLTGGEAPRRLPTISVLSRLYTTYAQATLEEYGISIDLPSLCGDHLAYLKVQSINPCGPCGPAAAG